MTAPSFTARFPYSGPQHDRQKLMRASLASSCLRGEMCVWQFMAGVRGAEMRRRPHEWRWRLLQSGVFHRVAREPSLCGDELVRPMSGSYSSPDYDFLGVALRGGHTEMVEWCMGDQFPPFQHGMFHERPVEHDCLRAPLPTLMQSACEVGWDWGRRCIEQLVAESDDPVAVGMRESGEYAGVFAVACASAGSSNSLQWAKAFAADAGEERVLSLVAGTSTAGHVAGTCTLGVAEWLWRSYSGDLSTLVERAAFDGNWPMVEWLVRTGSINAATRLCVASAARHDNVAVLRFLRDHGLDSDYEHAARAAACTGSLCVLEWLWSEKPECITRDCVADAARCGSLCALEWLWLEKPEHITSDCVAEAAGSGDVSKVRFLLERCGLEWTDKDANTAAGFGHVRVLEWARDQGLATPQQVMWNGRLAPDPTLQFLLAYTPHLRCSVDDMAEACRQDLRVVEALHARFPDVLAQDSVGICLQKACRYNRADVVEFILRHVEAPVCTETALVDACATNHLELVQLLHGRFPDVALSSMAMQVACASGALEVVEWLHKEQGLAPNPDSALRNCHLCVLEFIVQHCGISGPQVQAGLPYMVQYNRLHVVEYLVRRGMVDDIDSLLQAVQEDNRKWPMQRFLRRHGASGSITGGMWYAYVCLLQ